MKAFNPVTVCLPVCLTVLFMLEKNRAQRPCVMDIELVYVSPCSDECRIAAL